MKATTAHPKKQSNKTQAQRRIAKKNKRQQPQATTMQAPVTPPIAPTTAPATTAPAPTTPATTP